MRSLTLIPWVVPGIVAATTWAWMFHTEFGIINYMLTATDVIDAPVGWLTDRDTVMPAMIAINVWKLFPFVAVMVLAGLQTVPKELYESARVDGASFWDEVRHVMLPSIRPVLVAITLLLLIWGLNAITIIYTITRGGPANRTLITPIQIFRQAFELFQFNQAAALSVMFFAVTIVFVAIYISPSARRRRSAPHDRLAGSRKVGIWRSACWCCSPSASSRSSWMALSSIKTLGELYTVPPVWLPEIADAGELQEGALRLERAALFPELDGDLARRDGDRAGAGDLRLLRLRPLQFPRQGRPTRPSSSSASCCRPRRSSCRSSSRCAGSAW